MSTRSPPVQTTHIKRVVLAHLSRKLRTYPIAHARVPRRIEPSQPLHRPHDPLVFALLGQHPSQPPIIRRPPKRKVEREKDLGGASRQHVEQHELQAEQRQVQRVQVALGVRRVEERGEHVVCRRHAKDCGVVSLQTPPWRMITHLDRRAFFPTRPRRVRGGACHRRRRGCHWVVFLRVVSVAVPVGLPAPSQ